ncbi:hypothetical protein ES703_10153 [subsurface metagenome]
MTQPDKVPRRIYACSMCEFRTPQRWILTRHLRRVHHLLKDEAKFWAAQSEYWLQPRYYRADMFGRADMVDSLEDEDEK